MTITSSALLVLRVYRCTMLLLLLLLVLVLVLMLQIRV
jgi:hypothetical protein